MTSASTKRRRKRNAALFSEWVGTPIGQRVTVTRANGTTLKTITESGPMMVDNKHAMICVKGIPGNTRLDRVRKGWNPGAAPGLGAEVLREMLKPPGQEDYDAAFKRAKGTAGYTQNGLQWNARAEKEVERLRTEMVLAMADCETALQVPGRMRDTLEAVARRLKAALERK